MGTGLRLSPLSAAVLWEPFWKMTLPQSSHNKLGQVGTGRGKNNSSSTRINNRFAAILWVLGLKLQSRSALESLCSWLGSEKIMLFMNLSSKVFRKTMKINWTKKLNQAVVKRAAPATYCGINMDQLRRRWSSAHVNVSVTLCHITDKFHKHHSGCCWLHKVTVLEDTPVHDYKCLQWWMVD